MQSFEFPAEKYKFLSTYSLGGYVAIGNNYQVSIKKEYSMTENSHQTRHITQTY